MTTADLTIPRVPAILRLHDVRVPHTNAAFVAIDAEGRRWVAKLEANMGCEAILAEAATWLLARAIDAPVPGAALCDDPDGRAWLSEWVPYGTHWQPAYANMLANPVDAAAILALDAVVFNEARHAGNLLGIDGGQGRVRIIAIDADEALVGHPADLSARGLVPPEPRILAPGFPPAGFRGSAMAVAARMQRLDAAVLRAIATEAAAAARDNDVAALYDILAARCGAAAAVTDAFLELVEARK